MPNLPDGASEDDTERDGLLSYAAEWHAFTIGVYNGMKSWRVRPKTLPANADVQSEPHYYKGGYAIGTVLQAAIVISAAAIATGNLPF